MTFLEKFTKDTIDGKWDAEWNYKDGSQTFSFVKAKHYLSGLSLSTNKDNKEILFPNGVGVLCDKADLEKLREAILVALSRYVDKCSQDYLANVEPVKETDKKDFPEPAEGGTEEVQ